MQQNSTGMFLSFHPSIHTPILVVKVLMMIKMMMMMMMMIIIIIIIIGQQSMVQCNLAYLLLRHLCYKQSDEILC